MTTITRYPYVDDPLPLSERAMHFEVSFRPTKAAYERIGRVLVEQCCAIRRSHRLSSECTTVLVECGQSAVKLLAEAARADHVQYRSPTRVFGSTLVPLHDTPEDEAAGRLSEPYQRLSTAAAERLLARSDEARRAADQDAAEP